MNSSVLQSELTSPLRPSFDQTQSAPNATAMTPITTLSSGSFSPDSSDALVANEEVNDGSNDLELWRNDDFKVNWLVADCCSWSRDESRDDNADAESCRGPGTGDGLAAEVYGWMTSSTRHGRGFAYPGLHAASRFHYFHIISLLNAANSTCKPT